MAASRSGARFRARDAAPIAGATVIGARMPLIAYNINLATDRLDVAKKIAAAIRLSSGGLRFVKAMGIALEDRGIVQVSMNLTNYEKTPIFRVFELVKREAARYGVACSRARSSGSCPRRRWSPRQWYLQLEGFTGDQVLENKLRARPAIRDNHASRVQTVAPRRTAPASFVTLRVSSCSASPGRPLLPRRRDAERLIFL